MKKNDYGLTKKQRKQIDEMYDKRAILLMADKKVNYISDLDTYVFLSNFTPINFKMFNICDIKFELIQKNIEDDYLVKIWFDEDGLFHAEDLVPGTNWFVERYERRKKKFIDSFGEFAEDDIFDD